MNLSTICTTALDVLWYGTVGGTRLVVRIGYYAYLRLCTVYCSNIVVNTVHLLLEAGSEKFLGDVSFAV